MTIFHDVSAPAKAKIKQKQEAQAVRVAQIYEIERERKKALEEARAIRSPRKIVYYLLIYFAIGADIIGVLAQPGNATGIAIPIISFISFCIGVFFFIVQSLLGKKISKNKNLTEGIIKKAKIIEKILRVARTAGTYAAKNFRRASTARFILIKSSRILKWLGKYAKWIQVVAESIPFVNALPWYTISTLLVYRDHKNSYTEAQKHIAELEGLLGIANNTINTN